MYKILLCCSAGMTSNMLVQSVKSAAEKKNIKIMVWSTAKTAVSLTWPDADCVLVAPQIASALPEIETMVDGKIPVALIDGETFSKMDGESILTQAISLIEK